jgi:hypothetical protein
LLISLIHHRKGHRYFLQNHLLWLITLFGFENGTQYLVPFHDLAQRLPQQPELQWAIDTDRGGNHISGRFRFKLG